MEKKICAICKKGIKKKDNYCRLTDYQKGEFLMEGFYHTLCYNDQINRKTPQQLKMRKAAEAMLMKASNLLEQAQGGPTYEVKG